jgi:hypothetical protein
LKTYLVTETGTYFREIEVLAEDEDTAEKLAKDGQGMLNSEGKTPEEFEIKEVV